MASSTELVTMFNQGEFGKLIARTFGGERGHVYQNQDADLLVVFPTEERVPSIQAIIDAATPFYCSKGYKVEERSRGEKTFELLVYFDRTEGCVHVVVTTPYSQQGADHAVWITTNRIF